MGSIDITKEDLIKQAPKVVGEEQQDLSKTIEQFTGVIDKVMGLVERGQKFQQMFGRNPENKQEMMRLQPAPTTERLGNASLQNLQNQYQDTINQQEKRIKELESMMHGNNNFKLNENKIDDKIEELFLMIYKIPKEVREQKLNDILEMKSFFKPVIKKYLLTAIPEVIEYEAKD